MQLKYPMVNYPSQLAPFEKPYSERSWGYYDQDMLEAPTVSEDFDYDNLYQKNNSSCKCQKNNKLIKTGLAVLGAYILLGS